MFFQKPPLGTQLDWSNPLNKGLVMHLAANEGNGDKVQDLSMYGNHGTMHNFAYPPTVASGWNPGRKGVGVNFDGVDDYVDCGSGIGKPLYWTTSAWIKRDASLYGSVIESQAGAYTEWGPRFWVGGVLKTYITHQTNSQAQSVTSTIGEDEVPIGTWAHISISVDGIDIKFYLNGILHDTVAQTVQMGGSDGHIAIGRMGSNSSCYFRGSIDEVRILNRATTAKEALDCAINPWQVYLDEDD